MLVSLILDFKKIFKGETETHAERDIDETKSREIIRKEIHEPINNTVPRSFYTLKSDLP